MSTGNDSKDGKPPAGKPEEGKATGPARPAGAKPPAPAKPPARPAAPKLEEVLGAPVPSPAVDALKEKFGEAAVEVSYWAGEVSAKVEAGKILEVCLFLRDDARTRMNLLSDLCGADYPKDEKRFEVLYHMYSIPLGQRLRVKARVAEGESIPSVTSVWSTANWHEREVFDLLGVRFSGHPDLTRILMPDDWEGHPLRKEYPLEGLPEQHPRFR